MRKLVLTILIVFIGLPILAQEEVHLPPAVLAAGGSPGGESTSMSRWRLSRVHTLTLPEDLFLSNNDLAQGYSELDRLVSIYPNPVETILYLKFDLPEAKEFILKLSDITGRVILINEVKIDLSDEILELNMSRFASAIYLLQIATPDLKERNIFRIQKI